MWTNPVVTAPSIVQVDFGAWGQNLPGDGDSYCGPTSIVMGLYWLAANGFTQLAPVVYNGQEDPAATNLELVIAGLLDTSSSAGTSSMDGVAVYLSACGIAPSQYQSASIGNPDLEWIGTQIAPNFDLDPEVIVLAQFSVGWYAPMKGRPDVLVNSGGHVLYPLVATMSGQLMVNNAYPASFFDVPNEPSQNPQTVAISALPAGLNLGSLNPPPSQDYSQVISGNKGNGSSYAILWGAQTWAISTSALPSSAGYQPSTWTLDQQQSINTNGGTLTVIAPLAGSGGLLKCGAGMLLLDNINALTGASGVSGGILASTQASGTPFGSSPMTIGGGGVLQLGYEATGSVKVAMASGDAATLTIDVGGGSLQLAGNVPYLVMIGGNNDGSTPNIARAAGGTLTIAPSAGTAALGTGQQVIVAGTDGNLPAISNGIVAPYVLGEDTASDASAGAFLTYDATAGFLAATVVSSEDEGINQVPGDAVYEVVDDQTIDGGAAVQVAALALDGGEVDGDDAVLQVGSQAAGDVAGVIMNGGDVNAGTLAFGGAEAVIYASDTDLSTAINSSITGLGGMTLFGPGALTLAGDSSAGLSGTINVNSGTLVAAAAGGSSTGSGEVVVNSAAVLQVTGMVGGSVSVGQSGVLFMDGGTVQGSVDIAATGATTSDPGGILQGGGTIDGTTTVGGVIQSGPDAAILTFAGTATVAGGSAIYWRLDGYYDDTDAEPGTYWNVLNFGSSDSVVGTKAATPTLFLDFSVLGSDPDGGNAFWQQRRTWTFMTFPPNGGSGWWWYGNFTYLSGGFTTNWDDDTGVVTLIWTPLASPRTEDERRRAEAEARLAPFGKDR